MQVKTTRRDCVCGSAALAVFSPKLVQAAKRNPGRTTELWFAKPADRWMEAVPVGNGRIGGMVFGGTSIERIALTESTVWSGAPSDQNISPTARENLGRIRELMFAGKYIEGRELCKEHLLGKPDSFGTNLPMATLELAFDEVSAVQDYRRSLDLDEAIAHVDYKQWSALFPARYSRPIPMTRSSSINCLISFGKLTLPGEVTTDGNILVLRGHAFEHMHSNGGQGVAFEARVRLLAEGGSVTAPCAGLRVTNVDALTLQVVIATNYRGADAAARCSRALEALRLKTFAPLCS